MNVSVDKVLIVGSGSAGRRHYGYAQRKFPNSEIFCIGSNSVPNYSDNILADFRQVKQFNADLIVIANAATNHASMLEYFAHDDNKIVVEKPLTSCPEELNPLLSLMPKLQEKTLVAYQLRFSQSLRKLKKEINSGRLGKILYGEIHVGQYLPDWRKGTDYKNGVSAQSRLGGGVLNELSHEIDLVHWIFGTPTLAEAQVLKLSNLELDCEDFANIQTIQRNEVGLHEWQLSIKLDMIRRDPLRVTEVIGEHGTLRWDGISGQLGLFDPESQCWVQLEKDQKQPHELLWEEIEQFAYTGQHSGATLGDGINVVNFIQSVRSNFSKAQGH